VRTTAALSLSLVLAGCSSAGTGTGDEIRIGLLLPYTGKDGSAGANYERGVLMAADQVNRAGGLYGKPLHISYADTHSSVERGLEGAKALVDEGVVAIIGPENDELARELSPVLDNADVSLVTPSSSSVAGSATSGGGLWFRLAPSGGDLGIALARRMKSEGVKRVAVVSTSAEYEVSFAKGVQGRLKDSGLSPVASQTISSGASGFSAPIGTLTDAAPDAIVLAADASTGSRFVNEFAVIAGSRGIRWYLSPTLEQQAFVLNAFPDIIEGMVGVAPAVSDNKAQTQAFSDAFVEHWKGLTPTTGAFFYYDALAMFALAFNGAASDSQSATPSSASVRAHMLTASGGTGIVVAWDELAK